MDNFFPYKEVSDDRIQHYLTQQSFADLTIAHNGIRTPTEEHAQRIASLVDLIQRGVHIHPVHVYINNTTCNEIEDGWHRFRAHLYLNQSMPIYLHEPED